MLRLCSRRSLVVDVLYEFGVTYTRPNRVAFPACRVAAVTRPRARAPPGLEMFSRSEAACQLQKWHRIKATSARAAGTAARV